MDILAGLEERRSCGSKSDSIRRHRSPLWTPNESKVYVSAGYRDISLGQNHRRLKFDVPNAHHRHGLALKVPIFVQRFQQRQTVPDLIPRPELTLQ